MQRRPIVTQPRNRLEAVGPLTLADSEGYISPYQSDCLTMRPFNPR
jgi:hypothetical protein